MITSAILFIWDGNKLFACFAISDMASNKKGARDGLQN